ncbi:Co2+/Mg2+ efflux protein ApaG [Segnochrobactrum spirostomi]|uniref:Protein ApaG n=1 Tax=Segnochrobactrum spirostomi TaxID=2608987 RepID=A0A6A7Y2Y8_9HYPH|nr:Co2+/Mg2+ efflux protein ApaG [Segnochrobactrum spirostomi]MQT12461.1 Co2+/Mg2+ efflux protein ApaG [Segnochrobactrum spirostomi]
MYRAVTRNIEITVAPRYVADESAPDDGRWFWAYKIEIVNRGDETVHLRSRHWIITDATGAVQVVRGAGVVGEQPVIQPGGRYSYTSGCPLGTPSGIMVGTYRMETPSGESFDVEIPAFSLDMPGARRTLN